jgi:hypothetical protein
MAEGAAIRAHAARANVKVNACRIMILKPVKVNVFKFVVD